MRLHPICWIGVFLACSAAVQAIPQTPSGATEVYARAADSVVLVETRDANAQRIGQASAFVVAPGLLLTNAHAVSGSSVWVKVGPVSIPAVVERTDSLNDLALLRVSAEFSLSPLKFAAANPASGARIFALGNPQGLERTITEGLVTAVRTIEGRRLLQISAAISPGSSGGPVLDERGEVVGVAVGSLRNAQNLNFAIPADIAGAFARNEPAKPELSSQSLAQIEALIERLKSTAWSDAPNSEYQQLTTRLRQSIAPAVANIQDEKLLLELFEKVKWLHTAIERPVAIRAVEVAPRNGSAQSNFAWSIQNQAVFERDKDRQRSLYREAEAAANIALTAATNENRRQRLGLLGGIQTALDDRREVGLTTLRQAIGTERDETAKSAALILFSQNRELKRFTEARKWFEYAEAIGSLPPYYYSSLGEMLEEAGDDQEAATAYLRATRFGGFVNLCNAARAFLKADQVDAAIARARECLDETTKTTDADATAAYAHRLLSIMLRERGVIDQAINHAKQSVAIEGDNGANFTTLTAALLKAERWSEAEAAAKSAIRLTDGVSGTDHFRLGSALFEQERWSEAKTSFEQSARMDPKDGASTYNIALCLVNLGFRRDAIYWYEESLRRDPNMPEAPQIRRRLQELRTQ